MKAAAKQLEFERAAALRDEIQQIRLRVLEQDASLIVGRAAERAASIASRHAGWPAPRIGRAARAATRPRPRARPLEVTSVTVLPADEEPADNLGRRALGIDENTAADWLPGIRDEHDDAGRGAAWLDRPTWDRTVTPNVRRRTGTRPSARRRR